MSMHFAASYLAMQLMAAAASAPASAPPDTPPPAKIAEDWTAAPAPSSQQIHSAVRDIVAEENAVPAEAPRRHEADTLSTSKYDTFAATFDEAAVPGCLRPDGLKRQPTSIGPFGLAGYLALPLILVAKLRGKCN